MKNNIISLSVLTILFFFTSCSVFIKKEKYSKNQLEYYNVYNANDTLIFQSLSTKKKDTSIVISKRIYTDADWFRNINQEIMDLRYTNNLFKNTLYYENSSNLFNNFYPNSISEFSCFYLRSTFKLDNATKKKDYVDLTLSKQNFNDVYELVYKRAKFYEGKDDDPEILYWDKKNGIIKYVTFNGEVWERINWH